MVHRYINEIIEWLVDDAIHYDGHISKFDYFSNITSSKRIIWSRENLLRFSFWLYSIFGYKYSMFPAIEFVEDKENDINLREIICKEIVFLCDEEFKIKNECKPIIIEMQKFLGVSQMQSNDILSKNFKIFNEELKKINNMISQEASKNTTKDKEAVLKEIVENIDELQPFVYDPTIQLHNEVYINNIPNLFKINELTPQTVAGRKIIQIIWAINDIISNTLPSEKIKFNITGVKTLLNLLQKGDYVFRNYWFIDDWAIDSETRASAEFDNLKDVISKIEYKNYENLYSYIFLKQDEIKFNIDIVDYLLTTPTELQCQQYIDSFKVAEGKYRIDNMLYDFESAINYVKENYKAESSKLSIVTNITSDSGFRVVFR